jgi:hypothetical protein
MSTIRRQSAIYLACHSPGIRVVDIKLDAVSAYFDRIDVDAIGIMGKVHIGGNQLH